MSVSKKKHSVASPALPYEEALASLKKSGLKVTEARKLVLTYLTKAHGPFTIEEIHSGIKNKSCNLTTIYRILSHLVEIGIVRKTDVGDRVARFEYQSEAHLHHHLICTHCKKVEIIEQDRIPSIERIAKSKGFQKVNPCIEIFGTCAKCAA
jgi:Fe2+ or Zn2+ uptake regulation protein